MPQGTSWCALNAIIVRSVPRARNADVMEGRDPHSGRRGHPVSRVAPRQAKPQVHEPRADPIVGR